MRIAGETIGARGATLLAVTAVVGILLANHGWSTRNNGRPPGGLSGPVASSVPATTAPPTSGPTAGPTASPAPAQTPGPKLSAQSYASYTYQVWPGQLSAVAQAAETGLVIKVTRQGSGISVTAGVAGQPVPAAKYYPAGVKVWVIEASTGDDSGNSDYNLGDDGLVVTDAQGRILE